MPDTNQTVASSRPSANSFGPRRQSGIRRWLAVALGLAGVGLSVVVWQVLASNQRLAIETRFGADADALTNLIQRQFDKNVDIIHFLSAFYASSDKVTRSEFRQFTVPVLSRHEEIRSLQWVPRVAATGEQTIDQARATLETQGTSQTGHDYRITERMPDGAMASALNRAEYFPVFFAEPHEKNHRLRGFDLDSDPSISKALEEARRTADPVVSGRVNLPCNEDTMEGLLVVGPIYDPPVGEDAPEEAEKNLSGFVVAAVDLDAMTEQALENAARKGLRIQVVERSVIEESQKETAPEESIPEQYIPRESIQEEYIPEEFIKTKPLRKSCPQWVIHCTATRAYLAKQKSRLPLAALLAGCFVTALVTMYVNVLIGRTAQVEQLVVLRAAELARTNEELKHEVAYRKRAEELIRDSEALYSSLVDNLPVQMLRKDLDGTFTFANRAFCELLDKPFAEIVGKTDFDFYPRELAEKFRDDDRRVMETGELFETVEENDKEGAARYVQVLKSRVHDSQGKIIGTQAIFWDVTKRKRAEADLEHERYLLQTLMDNLPHTIYFKDADSRFLRINKAQARHFQIADVSEAIGKSDSDYFAEEHSRVALEDEREIMRTGQPLIDMEEKEIWPDGHETWAATTKLPFYDQEGHIIGTFGVSRDVTVQRQAAEALLAAKEAAEAANRAKSDFLANISHEIRTPMNAVLGMTELVLDTELNSMQREYLRMVRESGEALLLVINDVLDFSKIEAGKIDLERTTFDLPEILGDTMKSLAIRAHGKGLELACQIHADVPANLIGDIGRLRQVVVNLVGNAIKFTDRGEVVLVVSRQSQADDDVTVHFAVSDTGIGIPEEKRNAIFDAFEQADATTTRRFGGTGLGLAIASRLIESMGGTIWVESEVGQGSTFHFTLCLKLAEGEPFAVRSEAAIRIRGLRTLVVDDNATNRMILEEMIRNWEMKPETVSGAREALVKIRQSHAQRNPYRLVLTDANMPDFDGFQLAKEIQEDNELGDPVVMMLTSGDRPGDVARCERLGVAAYLLKPIKQSELFDAIVLALGITTVEEQEADRPGAEPIRRLPPLRILLAEDSLVNQKLAVGLLEKQGHTVQVANHGREALAALETQAFDLVLMDIQMPEMDGLEATTAIRAKERQTGKHLPIVAMTAHVLKGDRESCLEAGMDGYCSKPIRANILFDTIGTVLGIPEDLDVVAQPLQTQPPRSGESAAIVDWPDALEAMKGDRDLLKVVVEAFLEEAPTLLTTITEAIAGKDAAALRVAAHSLKGSMRYFGAEQPSAHAYELEKMGRDNNLDGAEAALADLERGMAQLIPVLQDHLRGDENPSES